MKKQRLFVLLFLFFLVRISYSQDFQITPPRLQFDGIQLLISYDIITKRSNDKFYIWVEIRKKNGDTLNVKSISGDIGPFISAGNNKNITWIPEKDSIFLSEEIFTEVKAEKYIKTFNKGSMMLYSAIVPGLGQTKIKKGKPWWLIGVATYGILGGGYVAHRNYLNTYDSYIVEEDPLKREDLYTQAQKQMNISNTLFVSGASVWIANILWVALIPNNYLPLKNVSFSLDQSAGSFKGPVLFTLKYSF
jgi:hypothetical protein